MRILITTSVWGDKYRDLFANYSLASLLAPGNLPALSKRHHVTVQFITQRSDVRWLWSHRNVMKMEEFADLDMILMEDRNLPDKPPGERDPAKYTRITQTQNIAIRTACRHDAVIFNYADFIWSNGSLPNVVSLVDDVDAVLGFCLPVDMTSGKTVLASDGPIIVEPPDLAATALDHLHVEATYRKWDAPKFTRFPSYVIHPADDGVTVRAYHQTPLIARTRVLEGGIREGTLDGHFTSVIAGRGPVVHADDSDKVMIVSLHDGESHVGARGGNRGVTLAEFERKCTPEQLAFSKVPLHVRRHSQHPGGADVQPALHVLQP